MKFMLSVMLVAVSLFAAGCSGEPSEAEIKAAGDEVKGKTEMEAVIAYLQVLGTAVK